jgi:hypothetical protein
LQPRQQAKPVEESKADHRQKQQDLQTQQPTVGRIDQGSGTPNQQQGVERAGCGEQRNRHVSHLRETRHHLARYRGPFRAGRGPRSTQQPGQGKQPAEPQPGCE